MRAIQSGFSIVTAIFLLVVLSALGAFIVSVSGVQHLSQAYDVQGARAYQAARAGIEWGLYRVLQNSGSCAASANFVPAAIADFTVTVGCSASPTTNEGIAAETVTVYRITATACNQPTASGDCPNETSPGTGYTERQLTAIAGSGP